MASTNRLSQEKSPYLLQHADNPVDWYPWGNEAFEKAKKEDKPVFLSIGYATCHWCHVMAHESFEDETIAEMMNHSFVNIKVDREERPDIDNTYMLVCQMLTGSGGWPLNIFMTPDKKPFYAATYIPKRGRHGRPGMHELVPWIDNIWNNEREKIKDSSSEIVEAFQKSTKEQAGESLTEENLNTCYKQLEETFDRQYGGFGSAPKFPSPHTLMYLLRYRNRTDREEALPMVKHTLTQMRRGGLFDQIGFGFHRYSTDHKWLVPHFEKMLYDQAMHTMAYTEAWQVTGNKGFQQTARETLSYVLRDLQDEEGAFYSAEDADSEGEEGKFYVWSTDEIRNILTEDEAELAAECFNLSEEGNYQDEASGQQTGKNILHFTKPLEELAEEHNFSEDELTSTLERIRKKLFNAREKRERPLLDDKILTDWNGLIIAALAKAGNAFGEPDYIQQAEKAVNFILTELQKDDGQLLHRYRDGEAAITAHADDYAFLIWGLLELYNATFKIPYLQQAVNLQKTFDNQFWDEKHGGYFFTGHGAEELLGRKKESYDGAIPSGNSVAMMNLLKLGRITANPKWEEQADQIQKLFSTAVKKAPTGFTQLLQAVDFQLGPSFEITISGPKDRQDTQELLKKISKKFTPHAVIILNDPNQAIKDLAPYTQNQPMKNEQATAYVCRNYSCRLPTNDPEEMIQQLTQLRE